jgi:hypothetical protein
MCTLHITRGEFQFMRQAALMAVLWDSVPSPAYLTRRLLSTPATTQYSGLEPRAAVATPGIQIPPD